LQVTTELPALLNESDLHIAQLTLNLLTTIAKLHPTALTRVSEHILPEILILVKSPLLQGKVLHFNIKQIKSFTKLIHFEFEFLLNRCRIKFNA